MWNCTSKKSRYSLLYSVFVLFCILACWNVMVFFQDCISGSCCLTMFASLELPGDLLHATKYWRCGLCFGRWNKPMMHLNVSCSSTSCSAVPSSRVRAAGLVRVRDWLSTLHRGFRAFAVRFVAVLRPSPPEQLRRYPSSVWNSRLLQLPLAQLFQRKFYCMFKFYFVL